MHCCWCVTKSAVVLCIAPTASSSCGDLDLTPKESAHHASLHRLVPWIGSSWEALKREDDDDASLQISQIAAAAAARLSIHTAYALLGARPPALSAPSRPPLPSPSLGSFPPSLILTLTRDAAAIYAAPGRGESSLRPRAASRCLLLCRHHFHSIPAPFLARPGEKGGSCSRLAEWQRPGHGSAVRRRC